MDEITRRESDEIERRMTEAGIPFKRTIGGLSGCPMYGIPLEHHEATNRIFYQVQTGTDDEPPSPPSGGQAFG